MGVLKTLVANLEGLKGADDNHEALEHAGGKLQGLKGADDGHKGLEDAGGKLKGLEEGNDVPRALKMPVSNSRVSKVQMVTGAWKMPVANSRVSKVPVMVVAQLPLLPQPMQDPNIL